MPQATVQPQLVGGFIEKEVNLIENTWFLGFQHVPPSVNLLKDSLSRVSNGLFYYSYPWYIPPRSYIHSIGVQMSGLFGAVFWAAASLAINGVFAGEPGWAARIRSR